jgi:hypothetical protein
MLPSFKFVLHAELQSLLILLSAGGPSSVRVAGTLTGALTGSSLQSPADLLDDVRLSRSHLREVIEDGRSSVARKYCHLRTSHR